MVERPNHGFDLLDIEVEPTDERLAELMERVAESVRQKRIIGQQTVRHRWNPRWRKSMLPGFSRVS